MTFRKRARLIRARRHLNKGQIAIVAAKAYPETSQGKTSSKSEEVRRRFPVHQGALSQARTIIHYGPELAGAAGEGDDMSVSGDIAVATGAAFAESSSVRLLAEHQQHRQKHGDRSQGDRRSNS